MSEIVHARVLDHLTRLYLRHVAERLDAILSAAARQEPSYLDFLDQLLCEESAPSSARESPWASRSPTSPR